MKRESAVSFSEAVASARKRKRKRRIRKPALALTDAVRRFFAYQDKRRCRVGVFCFSGRAFFYREGCEKFRLYAKTAPGALVGIYDRHVKIAELVGDFEVFFF